MKLFKWVFAVLGVILLGFVAVDAVYNIRYQHRLGQLESQIHQEHVATVFVGGYGSSSRAFEQMTTHWQRAGIGGHRELVEVDHQGTLHFLGEQTPSTNQLIEVAFKDNRDPIIQMKLMQKIMHTLRVRQHITDVNFVTHSMGGADAYSYLVSTHRNAQPRVRKWVAIASPFGQIHTKRPIGKQYNQMLQRADRLPHDLKILTIAGDIWHMGGDTEVSVKGVKALKPIVQSHIASYQNVVLNGDLLSVQHSALRSNPEVIWRTAKFLYR
ncbi:MAG TPA: hypothetical protein DCW31_01750 [Lactobacillus sp.]|nr:hypothetical protein [Lactobacillus sp.]